MDETSFDKACERILPGQAVVRSKFLLFWWPEGAAPHAFLSETCESELLESSQLNLRETTLLALLCQTHSRREDGGQWLGEAESPSFGSAERVQAALMAMCGPQAPRGRNVKVSLPHSSTAWGFSGRGSEWWRERSKLSVEAFWKVLGLKVDLLNGCFKVEEQKTVAETTESRGKTAFKMNSSCFSFSTSLHALWFGMYSASSPSFYLL